MRVTTLSRAVAPSRRPLTRCWPSRPSPIWRLSLIHICNDLLHRIAQDPIFGVTEQELEGILQPEKYIGCAEMQTEDFLRECVQPVLDRHADIHAGKAEINV